jgi:hypothetical protein
MNEKRWQPQYCHLHLDPSRYPFPYRGHHSLSFNGFRTNSQCFLHFSNAIFRPGFQERNRFFFSDLAVQQQDLSHHCFGDIFLYPCFIKIVSIDQLSFDRHFGSFAQLFFGYNSRSPPGHQVVPLGIHHVHALGFLIGFASRNTETSHLYSALEGAYFRSITPRRPTNWTLLIFSYMVFLICVDEFVVSITAGAFPMAIQSCKAPNSLAGI